MKNRGLTVFVFKNNAEEIFFRKTIIFKDRETKELMGEYLVYGPFLSLNELLAYVNDFTEIPSKSIELSVEIDGCPLRIDFLKTGELFSGREGKIFSSTIAPAEESPGFLGRESSLVIISEIQSLINETQGAFDKKIHSMVIGGWAVIAYGYGRKTQDIDLMVGFGDNPSPFSKEAFELQDILLEKLKMRYNLSGESFSSCRPICDPEESFNKRVKRTPLPQIL